jgi:glutathione S-transferase
VKGFPVLTVHHLENSRSLRIIWLLEELGLPYEIKHYKRDSVTNLAPPELLAVHPLGKSPVVTDGATVMAESGAIMEQLVEAHGPQLRPAAGTPERNRYVYWMHFAEGSAMPPLVMALIFGRIKSAKMPFFAKPIANGIADKVLGGFVRPNIERQLTYMNDELKGRAWFCGTDFSAADVQMSFPVQAASARGGMDAAKHPHLADWLSRAEARPAYLRAVERGGALKLLR